MPTDDASPPPPASEGPTMNRRTLLKTGAGVAAVGAVTTRAGPLEDLSPVGGANAIAPLIAYAAVGVASGTGLGYLYGTTLDGAIDVVNENISEDELTAHQNSRSEMENYQLDIVQIENTLQDTETLAHQEARDEIATAWESGVPASDALSGALARIDQYYAERVENNWIEINAKSALQHAHAFQKALDAVLAGGESKDDTNPWAFGLFDHPTHGGSSWSEIKTTTEEREITLKDGAAKTVELPNILVKWDSPGISTTVNLGDLLNDYDRNGNGEFGFDVDGERATWVNKGIDIPNIPEANVPGYTVQHFEDDYIRIRDQIRSQADTVRGSFSQSLVEGIYAELDAGNITPADLRGIDGQARFLSNTEDATADAYQLALYQQLGMEQADLSKIASMTATYTGFEGLDVQKTDGGVREIWPGTHVDGVEYEGLLFAQQVSKGGLDVGSKYVADPTGYVASDGVVYAIDLRSGNVRWSRSTHNAYCGGVEITPDGTTVIVGGNQDDAKVVALDTEDGSQLWTYSGAGSGRTGVSIAPDSSFGISMDFGGVGAFDLSDGNQLWSASASDTIRGGGAISNDNSRVYYGTSSPEVVALNTSDGSEDWRTGVGDMVSDIASSPDGTIVVATSSGVTALGQSDGANQWGTGSQSVKNVDISSDGETVFYGTSSGSVHAVDATASGSSLWTFSNLSGSCGVATVGDIVIAGDDQSGDVVGLDRSDGSELWRTDGLATVPSTQPNEGLKMTIAYNGGVRPDLDPGGVVLGAYFYDAPTSEQVMLENGILTMTAMSNQDGDPIEETSTEDWGRPEYDQADTSAWADYMDQTEQYRESLSQYDLGDPPLVGGGSGGSWWPPSWWPSWLPSNPLYAGAAIVLGLAGVNAVTS